MIGSRMTKVKTFFDVAAKSAIPNPSYYVHILRARLSFSLKYFFALVAFLNFLFFLGLSGTVHPRAVLDLRAGLNKSVEAYPQDLVIQVERGVLSTSTGRPYLWWLDYRDKKILLAVVDETAVPEQIVNYNSYVLLTGAHQVVNTEKIPLLRPVQPYAKDFYIDKATAMDLGSRIDRKLGFLYSFFIPIVFLVLPLVIFAFFTIYILILSAVAHPLFVLFFRSTHPFAKTFQVALHAATIPLIAYYAVHYLRLSGEAIPYMPLIFVNLFVIFILAGLYEAYIEPQHRKR